MAAHPGRFATHPRVRLASARLLPTARLERCGALCIAGSSCLQGWRARPAGASWSTHHHNRSTTVLHRSHPMGACLCQRCMRLCRVCIKSTLGRNGCVVLSAARRQKPRVWGMRLRVRSHGVCFRRVISKTEVMQRAALKIPCMSQNKRTNERLKLKKCSILDLSTDG